MTAGGVDEVNFHADEAAGGDRRLDHGGDVQLFHVGELALAGGEILHDRADAVIGHFDPDGFVRLEEGAVFGGLGDDGRAGNEELEALAAHGLDEHGDLHGAAGFDVEGARALGVFDED